MRKNILKNKDGAALMIAIAIMAIVMMLSLVLLLVAFSLYNTSQKEFEMEQNRELAKTLSLRLQDELTITSNEPYKNPDPISKYPLWFYVRYNVWGDQWSDYDDSGASLSNTPKYAFRYFKVNSDTLVSDTQVDTSKLSKKLENISILLYWTKEDGASSSNKAGTKLIVSVTCGEADMKSTIVSEYSLGIDSGNDEDPDYKKLESNEIVNPEGNSINPKELWRWVFDERY